MHDCLFMFIKYKCYWLVNSRQLIFISLMSSIYRHVGNNVKVIWDIVGLGHVEIMQIWIVGDGLTEEEQSKALSGTIFIPFSQFPPKQVRKDCFYHSTPAMVVPSTFKNVHSCEVCISNLKYNFPDLRIFS